MRPTVTATPKVLTAGQVARALGIHRQTVYDRVKSGALIPSATTAEGVMIFSYEYIESIRTKKTATTSGER